MGAAASASDRELEQLLLELDRLEDLREEMQDLGVTDLDSLHRRVADLNARIDDLTGE
ncbi:MAG: hypothetical protein ACKOWF_17185 [Chloroflexota bacterium]